MILQQTLLALSLSLSLAIGQGQGAAVVPHFPPKPEPAAIDAAFTGWHGWTYLNGAPCKLPAIYETTGDWSEIQARFAALSGGKTSTWRLKVVIFTRIEADGRDKSGVLREQRATIESVQLGQVREALDRLSGYAAAKFNGAVSIVPDIQVESEWMRDSGADTFGAQFAKKYFEPRINGGTYESEDKVFRGPFNSVIYILPGTGAEQIPDSKVNDTPVAGVFANSMGDTGNSKSLDPILRETWLRQVQIRGREQGYRTVSVSAPQAEANDPWPALTSTDEVAASAYLSHLTLQLDLHPAVGEPAPFNVSILPASKATIVPDNERGQVLKVAEASGIREGGVALPERSDGMPLAKMDSAPTLGFFVKSASTDPLCVRLESGDGKTAWISLGRDPILLSQSRHTVVSFAMNADSKWHRVAVDLKALGLTSVQRMAIEPSPEAKIIGKQKPEPIEYFFDEFKFSVDAADSPLAEPTANATSEDPEARALFAAQAKAASPDLAKLLSDKSPLVRLNATSAYTGIKDPSVEQTLISNGLDLDPSVAAAALTALMAEGSDVARAVVKRSVSVGLSDYAKIVAGKLLATTKDPKAADDIARLLGNRTWQAHVAAVEALAEIPTPESQIWRLAFIGMTDPAIKLAVTRNADPSVDKVIGPLLWSSVNEPSDAVRAESYIKLIRAPLPATRTEGYKGVRDDSRFVRKLVVQFLAEHPLEDNRNALRLAVADRSPSVRAAALAGFAALEKGATNDEIANVFDDPSPVVQLALIDFSKKKAVKLPAKTVAAMQSSADPRVVEAAKGIGG